MEITREEAIELFDSGAEIEVEVFDKSAKRVYHEYSKVISINANHVRMESGMWETEDTVWYSKKYRVKSATLSVPQHCTLSTSSDFSKAHIEFTQDGWKVSMDKELKDLGDTRSVELPRNLLIKSFDVYDDLISIQAELLA